MYNNSEKGGMVNLSNLTPLLINNLVKIKSKDKNFYIRLPLGIASDRYQNKAEEIDKDDIIKLEEFTKKIWKY